MGQTQKIDPIFDFWLSVTFTSELLTWVLSMKHHLMMVKIFAK